MPRMPEGETSAAPGTGDDDNTTTPMGGGGVEVNQVEAEASAVSSGAVVVDDADETVPLRRMMSVTVAAGGSQEDAKEEELEEMEEVVVVKEVADGLVPATPEKHIMPTELFPDGPPEAPTKPKARIWDESDAEKMKKWAEDREKELLDLIEDESRVGGEYRKILDMMYNVEENTPASQIAILQRRWKDADEENKRLRKEIECMESQIRSMANDQRELANEYPEGDGKTLAKLRELISSLLRQCRRREGYLEIIGGINARLVGELTHSKDQNVRGKKEIMELRGVATELRRRAEGVELQLKDSNEIRDKLVARLRAKNTLFYDKGLEISKLMEFFDTSIISDDTGSEGCNETERVDASSACFDEMTMAALKKAAVSLAKQCVELEFRLESAKGGGDGEGSQPPMELSIDESPKAPSEKTADEPGNGAAEKRKPRDRRDEIKFLYPTEKARLLGETVEYLDEQIEEERKRSAEEINAVLRDQKLLAAKFPEGTEQECAKLRAEIAELRAASNERIRKWEGIGKINDRLSAAIKDKDNSIEEHRRMREYMKGQIDDRDKRVGELEDELVDAKKERDDFKILIEMRADADLEKGGAAPEKAPQEESEQEEEEMPDKVEETEDLKTKLNYLRTKYKELHDRLDKKRQVLRAKKLEISYFKQLGCQQGTPEDLDPEELKAAEMINAGAEHFNKMSKAELKQTILDFVKSSCEAQAFLEKIQERVTTFKNKFRAVTGEAIALGEKIERYEMRINRSKTELQRSNEIIHAKDAEITHLKSLVSRNDAQWAAREITHVNSVSNLGAMIAEFKHKAESLQERLNKNMDQDKRFKGNAVEIGLLRDQVIQRDNRIRQLECEVGALLDLKRRIEGATGMQDGEKLKESLDTLAKLEESAKAMVRELNASHADKQQNLDKIQQLEDAIEEEKKKTKQWVEKCDKLAMFWGGLPEQMSTYDPDALAEVCDAEVARITAEMIIDNPSGGELEDGSMENTLAIGKQKRDANFFKADYDAKTKLGEAIAKLQEMESKLIKRMTDAEWRDLALEILRFTSGQFHEVFASLGDMQKRNICLQWRGETALLALKLQRETFRLSSDQLKTHLDPTAQFAIDKAEIDGLNREVEAMGKTILDVNADREKAWAEVERLKGENKALSDEKTGLLSEKKLLEDAIDVNQSKWMECQEQVRIWTEENEKIEKLFNGWQEFAGYVTSTLGLFGNDGVVKPLMDSIVVTVEDSGDTKKAQIVREAFKEIEDGLNKWVEDLEGLLPANYEISSELGKRKREKTQGPGQTYSATISSPPKVRKVQKVQKVQKVEKAENGDVLDWDLFDEWVEDQLDADHAKYGGNSQRQAKKSFYEGEIEEYRARYRQIGMELLVLPDGRIPVKEYDKESKSFEWAWRKVDAVVDEPEDGLLDQLEREASRQLGDGAKGEADKKEEEEEVVECTQADPESGTLSYE